MKKLFSKLSLRPLFVAVCLVVAALSNASSASGAWARVRSENFVVAGNAGEGELRRAAVQLEELREVFTRLNATANMDVALPVTVVLFQSESDYEFFKPLHRGDLGLDVAGHFQFSPEMNYITLSAERARRPDATPVLFHEYVHALVRNNYQRAPLWFNEGLAEYYGSFELSRDRRQVRFGSQINQRVDSLERNELLPLKTLLSVDTSSSDYHEHGRHGVFYAESWVLVHYLLSDKTGARQARLARYLELAASGATVEESFRQAFGTDFGKLESELRAYVRDASYVERVETFAEPLPLELKLESRTLAEAEAQSLLGDLLLHAERRDDAEEYLARALKLDSNLAPAHAALGLLRLREERLDEAKAHLTRAVEAAPQNHLAHFYLADLLRREGLETDKTVAGYAETTRRIRAELKKTIELEPNFLPAYALLGLVDLERSSQVEETIALLRRASTLAPRRREFELLLARIHMRREEFAAARGILKPMLEPSAEHPVAPQVRAEVERLLEQVAMGEEVLAERKAQSLAMGGEGKLTEAAPPADAQPCDMPQPGPQFKKLRFGGQQACGQLVSIECEDTGVLLVVESGGRTLRLHSVALNRIRFVTYTADVYGRIECGLRTRATPVLITFRTAKDAHADGEVVAVEFVPPDWNHSTP
ncbi:MAG TPA: DUF1570 domain-containing protein [Pyrinomonadaceae bacterium]|nr:DUF1570 domain-containing protein [Pyrinomonadaceae bacterium]